MAKLTRGAKQRLIEAREDLAVAERELHVTLGALPPTLRAEKQMISEVLRLAIDKLTASRKKLDSLLED